MNKYLLELYPFPKSPLNKKNSAIPKIINRMLSDADYCISKGRIMMVPIWTIKGFE
jgi:hypothetical protein